MLWNSMLFELLQMKSPTKLSNHMENNMTYRQLLEILKNMDSARLNDDIILEIEEGEFYPIETAYNIEGSDVLDDGHLVLTIEHNTANQKKLGRI